MDPQVLEDGRVRLRPTSVGDLAMARGLFTDPGFYEHWDGAPKADAEIVEKYLGARRPGVECFFVEVDGSVVGFTQYHAADDGDQGGGMDLVLLPQARGQGIGTAVVRLLVGHIQRTLLWCRITVDPEVDNERGVTFWSRVGFVRTRLVDGDERPPYWLMERRSHPI
jgi:aminoglycoside 6'-N-acetyltransferase